MPSPIWTPAALSSEARPRRGRCWRIVEAQHRIATLKLVDDLEEQLLLEDLLERTKPSIPPECRHLHWLLFTPFRYGSPYPKGSRFRRQGLTPGVFYASEKVQTTIAEIAFHRLLFFADSPATPWPADAAEYTAFSALFRTRRAIDLAVPPLAADRAKWTNLHGYAATQDLADAARSAGITVIRYESARDPAGGINLALLTCRAFAAPQPAARQTWRIRLRASGLHAICEFPDMRISFDRETFRRDPRIAALRWER
jgi:RES domain